MKNYIFNIRAIAFSLFFISLNIASKAQFSASADDSSSIKNYQEKLYIRTDRDIYITGEEVWLKVYKMDALTGIPSDVSKVIYLELLDSSNNPVSQIKMPVNGISGSTGFRLSDTLSSGNYLIRAYTKWMLNYSEDLFFYKAITIINPFKNIDWLLIPSGSRNKETGLIFSGGNKSGTTEINKKNGDHIIIKAETDKIEYKTRAKVKLLVSVSGMKGDPAGADMSVSVVKTSLLNMEKLNSPDEIETRPGKNFFESDTNPGIKNNQPVSYLNDRNAHNRVRLSMGLLPAYMPEIEGQLISGVIKNRTTDEPLKNADISLSFVGKTARCQFVKTNNRGEFNFIVKGQYGLSELVIQPLLRDITDYYIELTQPYCNTFNEVKPGQFYIDSSKIESINNAIIGMQINNIYEPVRQSKLVPRIIAGRGDFYGKPDKSVKISDFIELTNIREITKEILPDLMVIKKNKKFTFKIINSYPFQPFENQALVLVDGVPVYDIENLLNVPARQIERVDIINARYFFSDNIFDGIVSFVTRKGDLSALDFDNTVYRQVFDGYKQQDDFYSPDYSTDSLKMSRIPDFRNLLYWKPDLKSAPDGKALVEFFTSDESGLYTIIVEGRSGDGEQGSFNIPLRVN